jgi:hypothetical protein
VFVGSCTAFESCVSECCWQRKSEGRGLQPEVCRCLCMRGCHNEWFRGSLVAIDLSPVSQNVVGTEGLWVLGFLTLRVRAIH